MSFRSQFSWFSSEVHAWNRFQETETISQRLTSDCCLSAVQTDISSSPGGGWTISLHVWLVLIQQAANREACERSDFNLHFRNVPMTWRQPAEDTCKATSGGVFNCQRVHDGQTIITARVETPVTDTRVLSAASLSHGWDCERSTCLHPFKMLQLHSEILF